jgi:hypothetical protein
VVVLGRCTISGGRLPIKKLGTVPASFSLSIAFSPAYWNIIALINGDIEAVSGPAGQDRPGAHEWIVWQGPAADKGEALQSAEKADPRVYLEWMRIRYGTPPRST